MGEQGHLAAGAVGHPHGVGAAAYSGDSYRRLPSLVPNASEASSATAAPSDIWQQSRMVSGSGDHGRGTDHFHGQQLRALGIGIMEGVGVVLDRHLGHLLDCGAEFVHVASHHHGVIAGVESAHRIVEIGVRGQGDEFVALPGVDPAHGLEPHGQADLHAPEAIASQADCRQRPPVAPPPSMRREGLGQSRDNPAPWLPALSWRVK
jgi:hypothetical protein